eukprot:1877152-Pleurochrysis_carterae.AAC.1
MAGDVPPQHFPFIGRRRPFAPTRRSVPAHPTAHAVAAPAPPEDLAASRGPRVSAAADTHLPTLQSGGEALSDTRRPLFDTTLCLASV